MCIKRYPSIIRIVAMILVTLLLVPTNAYASSPTTSPRASYYLDSYNTYIYPAALGKIQIYFHVVGVNTMDEIGILTIQIYESTDQTTWKWVETYRHNTTSGMLGSNDFFHSGHVDYQGSIGRYYKAYVCIWAGKDGDGDTRYMWTQPVKATFLAG